MEHNSLSLPYGIPVEDPHDDINFLTGHKARLASANSSRLKWLLIDNLTKLTVRPLGYSQRKRGGDAKQQLQESAEVSGKGKEKIAEEEEDAAMETDLYDTKEAADMDTEPIMMLPLEGLSLHSTTIPLARLQGVAMLPYLRVLQLTQELFEENSRFILGESFELPNPLHNEAIADEESEDSSEEEEEVKVRPPTSSASLFSMPPPTTLSGTMPAAFSFPSAPSPSFGGASSFSFGAATGIFPTPASRKPIAVGRPKKVTPMRFTTTKSPFGDVVALGSANQPEQTAVFWLPRLEVLRVVAPSSPIKMSLHEGASPRLKVLTLETLIGLSEILPSPTGRSPPPLSPMVELSTRYLIMFFFLGVRINPQ